MTDHDRAVCATTASLLRAAGLLALWGFALTCIAAAVLALTVRSLSLTATMAFGATVVLGALERYFALRVRLDAELFEALARGTIASLPSLDGALLRVGLRRVPEAERALDDRVLGARQLMQRHAIVVACQCAMFLLALMTQDLG